MQEQGRFSYSPKEDALGAEKRVRFSCERYGMGMETELAKVKRQKTCSERREGKDEGLAGSAGIGGIALLWGITLGMLREALADWVGRREYG